MEQYDDIEEQASVQRLAGDLSEPHEKIVAVSNIFANARNSMSLTELKTLVFALSHLKWTLAPEMQSNVVKLNKKALAKALGFRSDASDLSQNLWHAIKDLAPHSYIELSDKDRGTYDNGMFVTRISMQKNSESIRIKFEEEYFGLFTGLGSNYITLWSADIFQMSNRNSVRFYEKLRQLSFDAHRSNNGVYTYGFSIKAFGMPSEGKGSYMRAKGGFDRSNFEKYVLNPICADLSNCRMVQLVIQPNGKFYEKIKVSNKVLGYRFDWIYAPYPTVASAPETARVIERVENDPQLLKVAKDIVNGKGRKKKPLKKIPFQNVDQRSYDYAEVEKMLLGAVTEELAMDSQNMKGESTDETSIPQGSPGSDI